MSIKEKKRYVFAAGLLAAMFISLKSHAISEAHLYFDPYMRFKVEEFQRSADGQTSFEEAYDPITGSLSVSVPLFDIPGNIPFSLSHEVIKLPKPEGPGSGQTPIIWNGIPRIEVTLIDSENAPGTFWHEGVGCDHLKDIWVTGEYGGAVVNIPGLTKSHIYGDYPNDRLVMENNYKIECLPREFPDNQIGEQAFRITTTEGVQYTFSKALYYSYDEASWAYDGTHPDDYYYGQYPFTAYQFVTRIEDKFGNFIDFDYEQDRYKFTYQTNSYQFIPIDPSPKRILKKITTSDGVEVVFSLADDGTYSATMNDRKWSVYDNRHLYNAVNNHVQVTRPDGSQWTVNWNSISSTTFIKPKIFDGNRPQCPDPSSNSEDNDRYFKPTKAATLTTPSGLSNKYSFSSILHGRSRVHHREVVPGLRGSYGVAESLHCQVSEALSSKKITHPDGLTNEWHYEYSQNRGSYIDYPHDTAAASPVSGVALPSELSTIDLRHYKSTTVINPDNSSAQYLVNRHAESFLENRIVLINELDSNGDVISSTVNDFEKGDWIGAANWYDTNLELHYKAHVKIKSVRRDGTQYTTEYFNFNEYDAPQLIKEIGPSGTKYTKKTYHHDLNSWSINLPKAQQTSKTNSNFVTTEENSYKTVSNTNGSKSYQVYLPEFVYLFGAQHTHFAQYYPNGNVKRIEYNEPLDDGSGNRYIEYSDYKLGIAQLVTRPPRILDGSNNSATIVEEKVVDNNGWITSSTDARGTTTHFSYDDLGRVKGIDLENDSSFNRDWLDALFSWSDSETGPVRTAIRCTLNVHRTGCINGTQALTITSQYDGLYRLKLLTLEDSVNTGTGSTRYKNFSYTPFGKIEFASFVSSDPNEYEGKTFVYDALQRTKTITTSGLGTIQYAYQPNNKVQVTDAENNQTTTTYQAYGTPEYSLAAFIVSPESVNTDIKIDIFGMIQSVTQSGPGKATNTTVSQTEKYYYDQFKHLCLVTRKDTGGAATKKNILGEIEWVAQGIASNTTSCLTGQPNNAISYSYDNLGYLTEVNYPDASPDIQYVRDNNGNVELLVAGSVAHLYSYNNLNLLEDENLSIVNDKSFFLEYAYDALGNRNAITYPDSMTVNYSPNAFGEPTQALREATGGYASYTYANNAIYHPAGSIDSFTYGNGLTHKTTVNKARLPESIKDTSSSVNALHYSYQYDNNLNINQLIDELNSSFSLTDLQYDGLNRLTSTTGNSGIGSSTIRYDGLGNITYYQSKDSTLDYTYNTALNRLTSVAGTGSAAKNYPSFQYDTRGNITNNSHRSFTFNLANQLTISGSNSYVYDGFNRRVRSKDSKGVSYSFYNQDGMLVYRETPSGGINYIYLGDRLVAKDGVIPETSGQQHYRPYGSSIEGEVDDVGYTGHKFDTDLGLSYMQARYYDPVIGRFYSNDPVEALEHLNQGNIHGFNRYAYANNNPYRYIDPNGSSPISVLAKQTLKVGIKQGVRKMGQRQLRRLGRYMDKAGLDKNAFKDQVETILGGLDSSPLEIAFEFIPVVGDIYGGAKFGKEVASVYGKMQKLENEWVDKILKALPPKERKKFITAMRNAGVRDAKKDQGISKTGSGKEMHHNDEVQHSPERASDPRHIEALPPEEHKKRHKTHL